MTKRLAEYSTARRTRADLIHSGNDLPVQSNGLIRRAYTRCKSMCPLGFGEAPLRLAEQEPRNPALRAVTFPVGFGEAPLRLAEQEARNPALRAVTFRLSACNRSRRPSRSAAPRRRPRVSCGASSRSRAPSW